MTSKRAAVAALSEFRLSHALCKYSMYNNNNNNNNQDNVYGAVIMT